jgi:hypothetical protein
MTEATTSPDPSVCAITPDELEIAREVSARWAWPDFIDDDAATGGLCLGPFTVEKSMVTIEEKTIRGTRSRRVPEWVLMETIMVSGYPSEPDYDDLVEFDTVHGSIWDVLKTLRLREKSWEIRNDLDNIGMARAFRKDPLAEEY